MPSFRDTMSGIAQFAAKKTKTAATAAARKTKTVSRIARLNVDIASDRDTIKQAYNEIGKLYFETHKDDPEPCFEQLCREIETCLETIAAKEAEIIRLKTKDLAASAEDPGPAIEVEIVEEPEEPEDIPDTTNE